MATFSGPSVQFKFFFIMLTLFAATWLTADIAAIKLVSIFGITLTGGFFIFPLTTMLGCIIVEVYGYKNARQAIWSGLLLNLFFIISMNLVYLIPSSHYRQINEQFKHIFMPETRIILASIVSFFISAFINSYLMAKMKLEQKRSLVKRIMISSACSFLFDVSCFLTLAFYGTMPDLVLVTLILYAYIKKIVFQFLLFPVILLCINWLKKLEAIDINDYDTRFNPFSLDNIYKIKISHVSP